MSKITFRRIWFVTEEAEFSSDKFCVDDAAEVPQKGDFVDGPIGGWVKLRQFNYYPEKDDRGNQTGLHEVINIYLGKKE